MSFWRHVVRTAIRGSGDPRIADTHTAVNAVGTRTFSGGDIRVLAYAPPNPLAPAGNTLGGVIEIATLQTITISSHRPPDAVRVLGHANPLSYVQGVRTFAGTMIFNRIDREAFLSIYSRSEHERPDKIPFFLDQLPPFHVIIHAENELGAQASSGIMGMRITDYGGAFSIDDLVGDETYSYVASYYRPFMDRNQWRKEIRVAVSMPKQTQRVASSLAPSTTSRSIGSTPIGDPTESRLGIYGDDVDSAESYE